MSFATEDNIQEHEEEDRRERAAHGITLKKFGAKLIVSDHALSPRWLKRHRSLIESIQREEQQKLHDRLIDLLFSGEAP